MRRRFLAIGAVTVILAVGCSSGHHGATGPTTSSVDAATPNPDVVPSVITPAYVDAVFRVLNHIYGNATRELVTSRAVTSEVESNLRAIFSKPLYEQQVVEAQQSLGGPIDNVKPDPGDAVTVVVRIVSASPTCIFVETTTSLGAVLVKPTPTPAQEYYELGRREPGEVTASPNGTPWVITYNIDFLKPAPTPTRCVSQ